jgi:GNAT superfamily N-acetyltransferase
MLEISTDPAALDMDVVHVELSERAYWALGRPREVTERAFANSLSFAAVADGALAGFGRVVTDRAVFGYLADVLVLEEHRGRGVGKALVRAMVEHPDLQVTGKLMLATADAHGLYERFGFVALDDAERWLQRRPAG